MSSSSCRMKDLFGSHNQPPHQCKIEKASDVERAQKRSKPSYPNRRRGLGGHIGYRHPRQKTLFDCQFKKIPKSTPIVTPENVELETHTVLDFESNIVVDLVSQEEVEFIDLVSDEEDNGLKETSVNFLDLSGLTYRQETPSETQEYSQFMAALEMPWADSRLKNQDFKSPDFQDVVGAELSRVRKDLQSMAEVEDVFKDDLEYHNCQKECEPEIESEADRDLRFIAEIGESLKDVFEFHCLMKECEPESESDTESDMETFLTF